MLLGIWENIEHLEETLNMEELNAILSAGRDRDMRHWKFQASLKGINLDDADEKEDQRETGEEALARVKRRAAIRASGVTNEAEVARKVERMEIFEVGLDFEEG